MQVRQQGCRQCEQMTSGDCGMHGPQIITLPNGLVGTYRFEPLPRCFICGALGYGGDHLGYGSKFDGEFVCWNCIAKVLDPAIEAARSQP